MKKLVFTILISVFGFTAFTQIQSEYSTAYSGNWAKLEKDGSVFYTMDVTGERCRIYKPGYQLWKTVRIDVPKDNWLTDIQFVSQHLFNTDDAVEMLIVYYEYVQTSTSYYYIYTTQVINENGDVLLSVPMGSYSLIKNTDDGTKLMVYETDYSVYPYPVTTHIYRIPGVLMGVDLEENNSSGEIINAFPNPSDGNFSLRYTIPGQPRESWFILFNNAGSEVLREPLRPDGMNAEISRPGLKSGQYIYRIVTPNYQTKGQKLIINK